MFDRIPYMLIASNHQPLLEDLELAVEVLQVHLDLDIYSKLSEKMKCDPRILQTVAYSL